VRIIASNTLLASDSLAAGRVGPVDMAFNGEAVVDSSQLFRAASAVVFGRGDGPVEFSFRVRALFGTHAKAVRFCALHREIIPVECELHVEDTDEGIYLSMAQAVRSVRFGPVVGCSVDVFYTFRGAKFESEDLPEDLEENTDIMKVGTANLSEGDESKAVTFENPFASIPRSVDAVVERPSGQPPIGVAGVADVTEAGFTVLFLGIVPAANYKLRWKATL
jgi:hypothetical protein